MIAVSTLLARALAAMLIFSLLAADVGAQPAAGDSVTYVHTDALGSPIARTDATGSVISRTLYEPYGLQASGPQPTVGLGLHRARERSGYGAGVYAAAVL